jgi:hypothetical protein
MTNGKTCFDEWILTQGREIRPVSFETWAARRREGSADGSVRIEGNVVYFEYTGSAETGQGLSRGCLSLPDGRVQAEGSVPNLLPVLRRLREGDARADLRSKVRRGAAGFRPLRRHAVSVQGHGGSDGLNRGASQRGACACITGPPLLPTLSSRPGSILESARELTPETSSDFRGVWSPDGHWIYFISNRDGTNQIWRIPSAGGPAVQVTRGGAAYAVVSGDGRHLYWAKSELGAGVWRIRKDGKERPRCCAGRSPMPSTGRSRQRASVIRPWRSGEVAEPTLRERGRTIRSADGGLEAGPGATGRSSLRPLQLRRDLARPASSPGPGQGRQRYNQVRGGRRGWDGWSSASAGSTLRRESSAGATAGLSCPRGP